jgi:hypothetical protein
VHVGDELAHVREGGGVRVDDDGEAVVHGHEVEVGDDHRDLHQLVDREVEPRHLAVDPHQPVRVVAHPPILSAGPGAPSPPPTMGE